VTPDQDQLAARQLAEAQAGDAAAYDALLRLLAEAARVFVGRRIAWAEWGEDVVQDILLTVHRVRHTYDPTRPIGPWFYAIASTRLIDALRARRRVILREVADDQALDRQAGPLHPDAPLPGVSRSLAVAVASLPRVQREVVSLLKYEDLSVREVATRLGMTEAAVKSTAHRGYARLRSKVKGRLREDR
jgi:RNA polymerase sigma-70 factor (ECF subfamily)